MLKFFRRRGERTTDEPTVPSLADTNPDLRIRDLLDDPGLRRAMGLEPLDAQLHAVAA